jgi:glycerol-3-phosphate dehydrogenase
MARTLEDVLARRTRALYLDARESINIAPAAVSIMAGELGKDREWISSQLDQYMTLAKRYLVDAGM